jgi:cobalt-precorrin 5A hydrolase
MDLDQAMIVAGVGCRKGATAAEVEAAVAAALDRAGLAAPALSAIATSAAKSNEAGIAAAAATLGVPLLLVPHAELEAAGPRTLTSSARVMAATGVPSLAEAAALAAGGPTAQLISPRVAIGPATCALAKRGNAS